VAILNTGRHVHLKIWPNNGAKDQALPGSSLQTRFSLKNGWVFVDRRSEHLLQSNRAGRVREGRYQN